MVFTKWHWTGSVKQYGSRDVFPYFHKLPIDPIRSVGVTSEHEWPQQQGWQTHERSGGWWVTHTLSFFPNTPLDVLSSLLLLLLLLVLLLRRAPHKESHSAPLTNQRGIEIEDYWQSMRRAWPEKPREVRVLPFTPWLHEVACCARG